MAAALTFTDFLEALGRTAEMMCPPTLEELSVTGFTSSGTPYFAYYSAMAADNWALQDRPSAGVAAPKTRPLHEKLKVVLEVLGNALAPAMDSRSKEQALVKMRRVIDKAIIKNPDRQ